MNFSIATSYFYMIRHFTPNLIPVSVCVSDPAWYRPPADKEYYIDKRGIVCGLRYEPLIVQKCGTCGCPSPECCWYAISKIHPCPCMQEYEQLLNTLVDKERTLKAFEHCCKKFNADTIVLIVYETPTNPCSERYALQRFFNCKELEYPIK